MKVLVGLFFKLLSFQNELIIVTKESSDYYFEDNLSDKINDLRSTENCVYVIVRKTDIRSIEAIGLEQSKYFTSIENLDSLKIKIIDNTIIQNSNISNINLLPKYLTPTFFIHSDKFSIFQNPEFWKCAFDFEKINLLYDGKSFTISPVKESTDKENIFKSIIDVEDGQTSETSSLDTFV